MMVEQAVKTTGAEAPMKIPEGRPKSGRVWKVKQVVRSSSHQRKGVLSHLSKGFETKQAIRRKMKNLKDLEQEMIEEKKRKKAEAKAKREEQQKRRAENEYKNTVYQKLKPEKLKGMSKKSLRNIRKTAVNKFGQVELVNPWEQTVKKRTK